MYQYLLKINDKLRNFFWERGSSFIQLFVTFSVIGIIITVFFTTSIYFAMYDSVKTNTQDNLIISNNQIKNTIEREIQTVEKLYSGFSTTNEFSKLVSEPFTIQDFQKYRAINTQLNYFSTFSLPNTVYSITSLDEMWNIRDGRLTQLTEEDVFELENTYIKNTQDNLYWIQEDNKLQQISLLPIFSNRKTAIGMAEFPQENLLALINTDNDAIPFYIINRNNDILFSSQSDEEMSSDDFINQLLNQTKDLTKKRNSGAMDLTFDSKDYSGFVYTKSDYNDWLYITLLDKEIISSTLGFVRNGLILTAIVIILILLLGAYYFASRVTKPIKTLMQRLNYSAIAEERINDWDFIGSKFDAIESEKNKLTTIYELQHPDLKKQFMRNLYKNQVLESELSDKLSLLQYPDQSDKVFSIMVIQIDGYGERTVNNPDIFLYGVNQIVTEIVAKDKRLTPIVHNDKHQVTLLSLDCSDDLAKKELTEIANHLIETIEQVLKISISIAFSPQYNNLLHSRENLHLAEQTLSYQLLLGNQSIIFYDEVKQMISEPEISSYPYDLESQILQAIRLGETSRVEQLAPDLLSQLFKSSNSPINVQVALLRFALSLLQLAQSTNAESLDNSRASQMYNKILQMGPANELEDYLLNSVIFPLVNELHQKNAEQFQGISDQMIQIIHNQYDQDISLDSIGDELHYNPNYLSNLFKKETGVTFSDYLTSYRFEIAKDWLINTDITIKEISERLQYNNSQNFIRSFKRRESITPGVFRKENRPD